MRNRLPSLAWQVFRGSDALREGLLSPKQLRGSDWRHLGHDLYSDSRLERDHALRCHALALQLKEEAFFGGPSAAFLFGIEHAATFDDPVHLVVPAGLRLNTRHLTVVHRMVLNRRDHTMHNGLPVTTPLRTCWDVALWLDLIKAVAIIDSLLSASLVTPAQLDGFIEQRLGRHGSRRAQRAFVMADGGAQSPQESRLRVHLIQAGLPRPCTQYPITTAKGRVLHPDLAWPEFKVAVEYDGEWHGGSDQLHLDRQRLNSLQAAGWTVIYVTALRMRRDFNGVVDEVRQALRLRGWQG